MFCDNHALALFGSFGWQEILVILVIVLILFGGKKLPELARGLGKGLREFKKEIRDVQDSVEKDDQTPPPSDTQ